MFLASRCTIAIAALPNTPRVVPDARVTPMIFGIGADPQAAAVSQRRADEAGGTGERVAHEPLTGRVATGRLVSARSGPVGERATPTRYAVRGPCPWDRTRVVRELSWAARRRGASCGTRSRRGRIRRDAQAPRRRRAHCLFSTSD